MGYAKTIAPILYEHPFNLTAAMWVVDNTIGDVGPFTYAIPSTIPFFNIASAFLDIYFSNVNNTFAGSNYLNNNSYIKCRKDATGTYNNAIYFPTTTFDTGSQGYLNGGRIYGNVDIKSEVEAGHNLQVIWSQVVSAQNQFQFEGLKYFILRIYYN